MNPSAVELDGQYRALREGAGLLDRSARGKLLLRGADVLEFLQGQLTNDVEALAPGGGCYSALLDRKGRMRADMRVLNLPAGGGVWIDTESGPLDAVRGHLEMYKIGRDVELEDVSSGWAILSLIGPRSAELLGGSPLGAEHEVVERRLEELAPLVVTTDLGADLLLPSEDRERAVELLLAAGAEPVDEAAAEIVRVEGGRPRFGAELDERTIPEEAGLNERAVSFDKGCYIGQETVARLHYRGKPNRHLRRLVLDGPAESGELVQLGERKLGTVGTVVLSPARGWLALAILRREAEPGAEVEVGAGASARVEDPS